MKRILALIVCLLSAQMMMAQTTELQAKRVRALDSVFINGRWVKSVGIDTALSGTNRDIVSIEAVRLHVANRMAGVASLYTTKNQFLDSIPFVPYFHIEKGNDSAGILFWGDSVKTFWSRNKNFF